MLDDLARYVAVADARRDRSAGRLRELLRHLREPERLAAEMGRDDRLRDEADLGAVDRELRAARVVAARLEHAARQPQPRPVAVALEAGAAADVRLVVGDGPPEPAPARRPRRVGAAAAHDEA